MAADLSDQQVKHLEMIQAVITRLGNDSFLVKGWAITVNGVFLGFAVNSGQPDLALVSLAPTLLFWSLDTYYLRSERLFRIFYERARQGGSSYVPFVMDGTGPAFVASLSAGREKDASSFWKTAWRPTLRWLYLGLIVAATLVFFLANGAEPDEAPSTKRAAYAIGNFGKIGGIALAVDGPDWSKSITSPSRDEVQMDMLNSLFGDLARRGDEVHSART